MSKQGWSKTERGDITFQQGYVEGYGAPGYAWCRAICDNRQLERIQCSENDLSLELYKLKAKWRHPDMPINLEEFELASQWCDHCGADTLDGSIFCVGKVFCGKCEPLIQGYIETFEERAAEREHQRNVQMEEERLSNLATVEALKSDAFHWKDGWFFKRLSDGSVDIFRSENGKDYVHPHLTIPSNEWASIIAQCSAHGEVDGGWERALKFHNTPPDAKEPR